MNMVTCSTVSVWWGGMYFLPHILFDKHNKFKMIENYGKVY